MAVIQSIGELVNLGTNSWLTVSYGSLRMYDQFNYDYATLYKTQPNIRTCVDFLARNIAQLGLHVFRRVSDTDRERLIDHPLAKILSQPLPPEFKVTRYRLIETLMGDLGVYFNAYWLKVKRSDANMPLSLLRIPPSYVTAYGGLVPDHYEMTLSGKLHAFSPNEIVHFRGYNAENAIEGLSPLETLRRVLAEEHAAGDYREHFWQNAARQAGIIERPKDAPEWSERARALFKAEFEALYAGGENSGKTAILEEGMTWKPGTFNAQESEYLEGRKLTREECARAYHIPLPMVGILDNATFCLPARVLVFTTTGPKPIGQIMAGEQVWSHDGHGFVSRRVLRSGQTGADRILLIKTQNRTLEANPTHPVLVRHLVKVPGAPLPESVGRVKSGQSRWHYEVHHDYVPAGQIARGDILVVLNELPEGETRQSIARMELLGLLLGDGNVYPEKGSISIARANDAPYMDYYREVIRQEFVNFGNAGNGKTRDGLPTQPVTLNEGDRQTRFCSVLAAEELERLGFSGTAHTKRVPGWVFETTRDERFAFLRGYLDSDGSIDKRGKVSFSSCSRDLIEDIRHLCMGLGIAVNNVYHCQRKDIPLPNGKRGDVDQWMITCADPEANRLIGTHDPRYCERLANGHGFDKKAKDYPIARGRRSMPPIGCAYSRVVSVDELPKESVFDIEIEDTHSFIAAGVIVHNSNIREQHRNLYQDSLGPWLAMIEQEIELQLMPEFSDTAGVYVEFNIAEKMSGSFEEQIAAFQSAVGRPWMTADEARARMNLPSMGGDAEQLVTPLNVLVGGQASPRDSAPGKSGVKRQTSGEVDPTQPELREQWRKRWTRHMVGVFERQRDVVMKRMKSIPDIAVLWDAARWNAELTGDFRKLSAATTMDFAQYVSEQLDVDLDESEMETWIAENSRIAAEKVNGTTQAQIEEALRADDPLDALKNVFLVALSTRAAEIALSRTTSLANFGTMNAARQGGLKTKTWHVNSANPRPSHARLNGVTVGIKELFPNNLLWPGDPRGSADEVANCSCSVTFVR